MKSLMTKLGITLATLKLGLVSVLAQVTIIREPLQ